MAETFEALRRGESGVTQRLCVKRILPAYENDQAFVELFLEEARVSARLHHGAIAQVLDFGIVEGSHYLALELVEGMDLRAVLSRLAAVQDRLTTGVVAHLAFELGGALDYAHAAAETGRARGVVHRDISPSNVLLSRAGEVKLTDFGIAKAMSADVATRTAAVKGKLPYMAPEYATVGHFDARSDLFSLGVTLYECLVGTRPFDGANDLETLHNLQHGLYTRLQDALPGVEPSFAAAVERLLEVDPERRYARADDFLDDIAKLNPPGTVQLILGRVVRALQDAGDDELDEALANTELRGTELAGGTLALATPARKPSSAVLGERALPDVHNAAPDAETRTRLPTVLAEDPVDDRVGELGAGARPEPTPTRRLGRTPSPKLANPPEPPKKSDD